ncbi:hypothetical protein ONZ45_g18201 [Pleurotus djamor]|nr:hypothetical protein ONZ45_g18201 [Pleurotus djamor]
MASTAYVAQTDDLNNIFLGLRSKSNDVRAKSALDLRRYVANRVSEMTPDASAKIWNDTINRNLFDLMHSQNNSDRFGGLLAIGASHTAWSVAHANECTDQLLYVDTEESRRHRFRFYNYVRHQLPNHDINLMLAASKTLGKIALTGGSLFGDRFMEKEVPDAIELLQPDKQESPRYAGVLILKELAINSRPAFSAHVGVVLDNLLLPMRDPRVIVREGAADLLAICLEIVTDRDKKSPLPQKILQDAQLGLKHSQPEVIHGSLLTYRELFLYGKMFMKDSFMDSAETILRFKSHRDALVRRAVIALIPTLAGYDTAMFIEHFLHKSMAHLLTQLDKPSERSYAFIAIGHTASSVHGDMKPFLEQIMLNAKSCLLMRGKKNATSEEPVLQCIGMLATAVGPNLTKLLHDQLDLIFACGLSKALKSCLTDIAKAIPPLLKTIQDRLLDMLSHILSGQPYKPLGAPASLSREPHVMARELSTQANDQNIERIQLALETLTAFDFTGHVLNEFVRNCALPYMESDNVNIRGAAADTCCRLFIRDPICYQASSHAIEIISDVLDKLLTVGVADPVASIRNAVLKSLNDRFDKHLAQAENVRSLFIALNDEEFENRLAAVKLIGRLAKHNPAYVMPSLRKAFIQLLTELEFSTVTRNREECTRLLTELVIATSRLIKPYALSMLHALLPKASDNAPTIATNVLMCLGELCVVAGEDALPKVPDLMQVILPRLSDPSTVKRDAALHTLGQICSHTSYVIAPLVDYPQLLPMLGRILRTEHSQEVKRQVVKVLGRLGALDPFRRKSKTQEEAANDTVMTTVSASVAAQNTAAVGTEDYFQTVVITALLAILKDPALSGHHHTVIEAIMSIFKTQGLKCAVFLPQIIPAFSHVAKTSTVRMQEFHLQQLAILVGIIKQHVRNHMVGMYSLINEMWDSDNPALQLPVMTLIEALGSALDAEAKPFLASVIPPILNVFDGELTDKRMNTQMKICDVFVSFGSNIEEYLQLVIPMIVRTYERPDASPQLRKKAIQTIELLSARVNFSDHASRIIHPLVRVLDTATNDIRQTALDALCAFVYQLGSDFAIFVSTIQKVMAKHRISHPKYEGLITKLLNGERLVQEGVEASDNNRPPEYSAPAEATKLTVNQQHLKQAWDVSQVSTKEEWLDWMHHLEVEFMKESPSHALRACMSLVDIHPPLAKELFNAAFLSCWGELYDQYQEDLVRSIEFAITSNTTPGELVHRLLELAEFMEHEDKPLPIEHRTLGEQAMKYYAFAKALHYKELEFFSESSPTIIESLIAINTRLHQHDAAWGTLITAGEQYDVTKHEEWYERLGRWQEALTVYEKKAELNPGGVG